MHSINDLLYTYLRLTASVLYKDLAVRKRFLDSLEKMGLFVRMSYLAFDPSLRLW